MRRDRYDLVVLGGGTGGLVSAHIAAGIGARVALVERERTGGDCLWTGCVPSKALIAAAGLAHRMRCAGRVGLAPVEPRIDFGSVMRHVRASRDALAPQDSEEHLRAVGVEVVSGQGRFLAPGVIGVGVRRLSYRSAIVATGSAPAVPHLPDLGGAAMLTNETIWDLDELPRRLVVLGGGPIGCELVQAFRRLGSEVVLVERDERLLGHEEPEASALVAACLAADGVEVRTGADLRAADVGPGDHVLVAVGRVPGTDDLGLEAIGARTDDRGALAVDERLRTTAPGVFGVGDVTGALPFTHVAAYHARVATPNALFGLRGRAGHAAVPWATFTDPEVGRVGLTEAQARERLGAARVAHHDYAHLDRAVVSGERTGFAKLVGDRRGRLVGATVAAPHGGEAIAELAAWVSVGARIDRVSRQVHAYPTFGEGPARAADAYLAARLVTPRTRTLARPVLALRRAARRYPDRAGPE